MSQAFHGILCISFPPFKNREKRFAHFAVLRAIVSCRYWLQQRGKVGMSSCSATANCPAKNYADDFFCVAVLDFLDFVKDKFYFFSEVVRIPLVEKRVGFVLTKFNVVLFHKRLVDGQKLFFFFCSELRFVNFSLA